MKNKGEGVQTQVFRRPAAAAKRAPKAAAAAKRAPKAAAGTGFPRSGERPTLGKMAVTYGSRVSYICTKDSNAKPRLYIQVHENQTRKHAAMIVDILQYVCKNDLDKSAALEYRAALLQ
eukprot:7885757-Pyramimonas_sp.AAC.2